MPNYCYSFNSATGLSMRLVTPDYATAAGEFMSFPEPATTAALQTQFPGYYAGRTQLLTYAQQKLDTVSAGGLTVNVAASGQPAENASVSTTAGGRADILGLMVEISQGATSITWYQSSINLTLTPAQVNVIAAAVAALRSGAYATWSAIVNAVNAGAITTTAQIDTPPSPIPAWPLNS